MKTIPVALILSTALIGTACVSKKQFDGVEAELAQCQSDKAQSEAKVITWEQRFDREAQRWETLGATINEQVPLALSELHAERERIIEIVPEQVQGEVEKYLDEYFSTVMTGFDKMAVDNREIKMQLSATQKVLERIGTDTQTISTETQTISAALDETLEDERALRQSEIAKREAVATQLSDLVALVLEFDNARVNCKGCPDRLKLNRKEREAITAFHSDLTARLSQLQSFAAEAAAPPAP